MHGVFRRENREIPRSPVPVDDARSWTGRAGWRVAGREGNANGGTPSMNDRGKSDSPVVPAKLPNNPAVAGEEVVEERGLPEGNAVSETRPGHGAGVSAPSALDRVRR